MKSSSRQSRSLLFPAIILIFLAAGAIWFLFMRNSSEHSARVATTSHEAPSTSAQIAHPSATGLSTQEDPAVEAPGNALEQSTPTPSPLLPTRENIPSAVETINSFYHYLDQQKYIQARHLDTPSRIYFPKLIQKLLDNPPVVIRETDDLLTVLKNNTHLFKILGKDNIFLLKEILSQEPDKIEDVIAGYYLLTMPPISSGQDVSLTIPEDAMLQYAGFFLNTMGGRLYLSRRDSRTRMLVTYYAIHIINQANIDGKNQYGLQLQPAIDMLTTEMETGGGHLRYKEAYLDTLYDLKEKYQ